MRVRLFVAAAVAVCAVSSASAQNIDLFARRVEATKEGTTTVHGGAAVVRLNNARGTEVGADVGWSRHLSTELSLSSVPHDLDAEAFGQSVDLGGTREKAYTAILSLHSDRKGRYDFHAGAGASRLTFQRVADTAELALLGVRSIEFHDKIVPVVDAGASFRLGPRWAITVDAKWFDIRTRTTA